MNLSAATLRELLDYHYSRRERVCDFLATIPPADLTRDMKTGWSSISATMVHCLESEEYWVQYALQKGKRPAFDYAAYPALEQVRSLAAEVQSRTLAYVAGLTDEDLRSTGSVTFSSGTVMEFTLAKVFVHIITHDVHHRGQVMAMARQQGHSPPELDLL